MQHFKLITESKHNVSAHDVQHPQYICVLDAYIYYALKMHVECVFLLTAVGVYSVSYLLKTIQIWWLRSVLEKWAKNINRETGIVG